MKVETFCAKFQNSPSKFLETKVKLNTCTLHDPVKKLVKVAFHLSSLANLISQLLNGTDKFSELVLARMNVHMEIGATKFSHSGGPKHEDLES